MRLDGKTALVTGGGTGIGRDIALALARAGATVTICGRRRGRLDEAVAFATASGLDLSAVVADVTDAASVAALMEAASKPAGTIDILVNNAGSFGAVGALWQVDAEDWWSDVTVNLRGAMLCTKAVLPFMLSRNAGVIVNLDGGGGADSANRGGSGYGASKAGLARLTETLARELITERHAIQVYGLFPGLVRSEMTESLVATPERAHWQSFVQNAFATGDYRPASDAANALLALLEIGGPDLSGRTFSVDDDFTEIARRRNEVARDELRIMRLRPLPKDH
ncbi:MAG: SDR family oxidoreductase [Devosia sp.]